MAASASQPTTPETHAAPLPSKAVPVTARAQPIDPAQRHVMIAEAAFFIAQARSFTPCRELDDWLAAEREIEQRLSSPEH